jgi:hypothetical protein
MFVASKNDQVCDKSHALKNDGERHQETDGAPHRAEVTVLSTTFFILGEIIARFRNGRTVTMEAVRVVVVDTRWLIRERRFSDFAAQIEIEKV